MHDPDLDDVDRLFSRLARADVPDELTAGVLARTTAAPARAAWPWVLATVLAVALLAVSGYQLGASLASTDGLDVLEAVLEDVSLLITAPGDVAAALGEVVPWGMLVLALASAAFLVWVAGLRPGQVLAWRG
jgi:hypothetical protein